MNVVLMTSRSGSSMVCRILAEHGLRWQDLGMNPYQQGRGEDVAFYHTYEHPSLKAAMKSCIHSNPVKRKWPLGDMVKVTNPRLDIIKEAMRLCDERQPIDFVKAGAEFAHLWQDWGDLAARKVNFIKVYRPPEDVANSLARRRLGAYDLGYEIAIKRLKLMDSIPGITVATNMLMSEEDWEHSGIEEGVVSCGVEFDPEMCGKAIEPEKFHV